MPDTKTPELTIKELNAKFKLRSDKRALFCVEYVIDLNGTQAAIRAGYSKKTADVIAAENLVLPKVMDCVAYLQSRRVKRLKYSADDLLQSLIAVEQMDILDLFAEDGFLLPVKEWPVVFRRNISAFEIIPIMRALKEGDEPTAVGLVDKLKLPDKQKNRDQLGRHIDIQAWREQLKVEGDSFVDRIKAAQERKKNKQNQKS